MKVRNSAGKVIETEIANLTFKPFNGANKYGRTSKVTTLKDALKKCGLKNGQTLSFHHQLRNGDSVVNATLDEVRELGVKDIRLAQTALFDVHEPVIEHIKEGTVSRIEGSINGIVGDYISKNPLKSPVILRSHGGRWAAVKKGELHPNIAVIAASSADMRGNATGLLGENAFGNIAYSLVDATYADYVIVVTDNLVDYPCPFYEITEGMVDYVVEIDRIGDPEKIVSGSLKITEDPMKQKIARDCINLMEAVGIIKNGMIFQAGAGGISLAAIKYLGERLEEKDIIAGTSTGGLTKFILDIYRAGRLRSISQCQCFDTDAVKFAQEHLEANTTIGNYADPTAKGRNIDLLDTVILGATEIDVNFNVNVNTHSDGRMLHGIGGHQDVSSAAFLTIMTAPVYRKENPIILDRVRTVSTPGDVVDAVVTNQGIAINPKRKDLIDLVRGKIDLVPIQELRNIAYEATGGPKEPRLGDEIIGITKYFDGTVLDNIYRVLE